MRIQHIRCPLCSYSNPGHPQITLPAKSNPGHPQIAVIQDASGRVLAADITALTEEGRKLPPLGPSEAWANVTGI